MLKITQKSHRKIIAETEKRQTETGGIMIGTIVDPIVIVAESPGSKAKMCSTRFEPDVEHDRKCLKREMKRHKGRVKFLGYWHKHPRFKPRPSGGDLRQARELAEGLGDSAPFFFLITTRRKAKVWIRAYRLKDAQGELESVDYKVIRGNSWRVKEALKKEPPCIVTRKMDLWADPDFQFYLTKRGKERLTSEVKSLKQAGFEVQVTRDKKESKRASILVKRDGRRILIIPPVEYPLNPPRVFTSGDELSELETLHAWNSDSTLKEVVKEALQQESKEQSSEYEVEKIEITLKLRRSSDESNIIQRAISEAQAIPEKVKDLRFYKRG